MDLQTLKDKIKSLNFKNHADIRAAAALPEILEGIIENIPVGTHDTQLIITTPYADGYSGLISDVDYNKYLDSLGLRFEEYVYIRAPFFSYTAVQSEFKDEIESALSLTGVTIEYIFGQFAVYGNNDTLFSGSGYLMFRANDADSHPVYGLYPVDF